MQERVESTRSGRVLISVFVALTVFSLFVWNMPQSELKKRLLTGVGPYVSALGLDQGWGVFSPNPPRQAAVLEARISYEDGSRRTWQPPRGGPVLDAYWDYRWAKHGELVAGEHHRKLWRPTAEWVFRQERRHGRRPVAVTLSRKVTELLPPGSSASEEQPQAYDFYTYSPAPAPTGPGTP